MIIRTNGVNLDAKCINVEFELISRVLGGRSTLKTALRSDFDLIELSISGLPAASWFYLINFMGWGRDESADYLTVSRRTVSRWTKTMKLSSGVSDEVLSIARVIARGIDVFGSKSKFQNWIRKPSKALESRQPLELIGSRIGLELVNDELLRIEYGEYV